MITLAKIPDILKALTAPSFYYEERGKGSPLVLCYGIGCFI